MEWITNRYLAAVISGSMWQVFRESARLIWPSQPPKPAAAYGTLAGLIESLVDAKAAGQLSRRLRV